jgi:hypothetical protein
LEKRPVEPAGSVLSANPFITLFRGLWPPFRVHPEVLRIFLHKPPQRCGGVFSSFYGVGGAGLFLFFSLVSNGVLPGVRGNRGFLSDSISLQQEKYYSRIFL